jgi:serine/threonine protein kinase
MDGAATPKWSWHAWNNHDGKAMTLIPGFVLSDRYVIHEEIGRGGFSLVYRAEDRRVGSEVAIKLLVPPPAMVQVARERMRREVRTARSLVHDNIVSVYDYIEDDEACYVVMEYIAGPDLARHVSEHGPLSAEETADLGKQVADALTEAHRSGILHRDVKPQNILIDPTGKARLADFGSARLDGQTSMTHTGGFVGTLSYQAPEVIRGQRHDARADIYALGLTLYYALTGDLPPRQSLQLPPEPSDNGFLVGDRVNVPTWLEDVVARATSANPGRRFATAAALADSNVGRGHEEAPAL